MLTVRGAEVIMVPRHCRKNLNRRTSMEIVAQWFHSAPEKAQAGLMLYGFVQLMAAIMMSRFLKRPEK
jgi:hypothetical protein